MQHPIHFHGQRFIIVARNGVPQTNLVWKDTALVRAGETVDVVVQMSNPGAWMTHCHISEHLESGMMLPFVVQ
jgi:FtsP/CotA-like multicopper oxidase with cupredoxin domain